MSYGHSAEQSIDGVVVEVGIPVAGVDVGGDEEVGGHQGFGRSFDFHSNRIFVEPAEYMRDVDTTSKFIDNNVVITVVAVPKFGSRILRVSVSTGGLPCCMTFAAISWPPPY